MTNHKEYDLRMGELIVKDDCKTLILHVYQKFKALTLQEHILPRLPPSHFNLIQIPPSFL